jgi:stage II sporulation protein D
MARLRPSGIFCLLFILPLPAQAAETIRVALVQNADSVTLTAASGLIIKAPNDDLDSNGRLVLSVGPTGLLADGRRLKSERLEARGRNGEIAVNGLTVAGRVIIKRQNGKLLAVNELPLEDYVKGVVPAEMSVAWHPEALKVQAIAARTYALYKIRQGGTKDFDVVASTKDQVYKGRAGANGSAGRAVDETRDQVLAFGNAPILAVYFSTAAGPTEDAMNVWAIDLPYLKGVECPFDMNSPYYQWRTDVWLPMLEQRLREEGFPVGVIAGLAPAFFSKAGRVTHVRILHSDGELYVKGEDLRRVLGQTVLASTQFEFEINGLQVQFTGRGSGHGVGLCQWGAKELAEKGYGAEAILRYYYPGTDLRDLSSLPRR